MTTPIRIGHSPDADDAFMFYALTEGKIPLGEFDIRHVIEDIETLNQRALRAGPYRDEFPLEVTALACHAYGFVSDRYQLLPYGASVGEGYGPIVVARQGWRGGLRSDRPAAIRGARIAVPGRYTTAYLVLQLYESDFEAVFTPFDQIFERVETGQTDLGLLIHEGQLTYEERGFEKVVDLGEWWLEAFGLPLPLGVNAIRRDLGERTIQAFSGLFRRSLDYALAHSDEALTYALRFGRGLDPHRGDRFVGMYVNDYALSLGEKGKRALELLYELAWRKNLLPEPLERRGLYVAPLG